jgi:hypothetical protein
MKNQFLKLTTKMNSARNLRLFLSGVQFHLEAQGATFNVFTVSKKITRNGMLVPNFYFDTDKFATVLEFINQHNQ